MPLPLPRFHQHLQFYEITRCQKSPSRLPKMEAQHLPAARCMSSAPGGGCGRNCGTLPGANGWAGSPGRMSCPCQPRTCFHRRRPGPLRSSSGTRRLCPLLASFSSDQTDSDFLRNSWEHPARAHGKAGLRHAELALSSRGACWISLCCQLSLWRPKRSLEDLAKSLKTPSTLNQPATVGSQRTAALLAHACTNLLLL